MFNILITSGLCLLVALVSPSCINQTDFEPSGGVASQVVIDGSITNSDGPHELKISRTRTGSLLMPRPILSAQAKLYDGAGNEYSFVEEGDGKYVLPKGVVTGTVGEAYHIEVALPDGKIYRSAPEVMPVLVAADSLYFDVATVEELNTNGTAIEAEYLRLYLDSEIPETTDGPYLRWETFEVHLFSEKVNPFNALDPTLVCYVRQNNDPQTVRLLSGGEVGDYISGQYIARRRLDFTFFEKHSFSVYQVSMTKPAFSYYERIDQVVNQVGTIFDKPAASFRGNTVNVNDPREDVLGYFQAVAVDTSHLFLTRDDLPVNILEFCSGPPSRYSPNCFNCLLFDNSSLERPGFW